MEERFTALQLKFFEKAQKLKNSKNIKTTVSRDGMKNKIETEQTGNRYTVPCRAAATSRPRNKQLHNSPC
jgi:hypothetical protein